MYVPSCDGLHQFKSTLSWGLVTQEGLSTNKEEGRGLVVSPYQWEGSDALALNTHKEEKRIC